MWLQTRSRTISDFKIFKEEIDEEGKVKEVEVEINEFTFNFDPLASDTTGRVRSKEGDPTESMVMIVKGFISPKEFLSNVTIKLEVSQGIIDAANQGYITLPECATLVGNNVFVTLKEGDTALLAETKLNDREREIMELRYGLKGKDEKTQREVADMLGISQSYISRLEKKIIGRLKKEFMKYN